VKGKQINKKLNRGATMKTKVTETKFKSALGLATRLFSTVTSLGAVILICSSASAQNLFVSGSACGGSESPNDAACAAIFEFSWDGVQSIFASGLNSSGDLTFDSAGNLFFVSCSACFTPHRSLVIYKVTPNGVWTTFASDSRPYTAYLAADQAGDLYVADSDHGIIYKYNPNGSRSTFASGLYHPVGMAVDSVGNLFAADNTNGNIHQGSIYEYKPDGSRVTFAVLDPSDRPADLALDGMGGLYMADLGGNIYRYSLGVLRRHSRTTFGFVPNSAQSLACDSSGNLFVVDTGGVNGTMIYKFTTQAVRSPFASGHTLGETFAYLAFEPMPCCQ
jgi:sugar lactone lactonase YvrE